MTAQRYPLSFCGSEYADRRAPKTKPISVGFHGVSGPSWFRNVHPRLAATRRTFGDGLSRPAESSVASGLDGRAWAVGLFDRSIADRDLAGTAERHEWPENRAVD